MGHANHPPVRILIFGAGAIGSLIGGLLSRRNDVTLVGRKGHVAAVNRHGLKIVGKTELVANMAATTEVPPGPFDLVLISTKAYDTPKAISALRPFWDSSLFLTLQNGLKNADLISEEVRRVAAGTTSHGVTFVADGLVRHAGLGDTRIGPFKNVSAREARMLCDEMTACGFPANPSDDIRRDLWVKVLVNASINPITAIARVQNGRLLTMPQLNTLLRMSSVEGATVARSEGYAISNGHAISAAEKVAKRTAENRSSMLQDIERGRRTEIAEISGAIIEVARSHGIAVPVVDTIRLSVGLLERRSGGQVSRSEDD